MSSPTVRITDPQAIRTGPLDRVMAYVALTKPRIIELLLITTVPAMILAADGWPGTWLVIATLIGGTLSAGGANAINNYIDRDIDRLMRRTSRRPLPTARVEPRRALVFGAVLGVVGFTWLWLATTLLAALLATAALLFYVFVYSVYLKRTTVQNIVIGGAAGAVPVLVGWAAVADSLGWAPLIMFGIVFYWTPPHFWALALRYREDYERAGVPMLPVVAGVDRTNRQILLYSVALTAVSLFLIPAGEMGWVYAGAALLLGLGFIAGAWRLRTRPDTAMQLFRYSNLYLSLLFAAIALDVFVSI